MNAAIARLDIGAELLDVARTGIVPFLGPLLGLFLAGGTGITTGLGQFVLVLVQALMDTSTAGFDVGTELLDLFLADALLGLGGRGILGLDLGHEQQGGSLRVQRTMRA